ELPPGGRVPAPGGGRGRVPVVRLTPRPTAQPVPGTAQLLGRLYRWVGGTARWRSGSPSPSSPYCWHSRPRRGRRRRGPRGRPPERRAVARTPGRWPGDPAERRRRAAVAARLGVRPLRGRRPAVLDLGVPGHRPDRAALDPAERRTGPGRAAPGELGDVG